MGNGMYEELTIVLGYIYNGLFSIGENGFKTIRMASNHMKSFTEEEVINFSNQRSFSPSICEYQISKGDSDPRKKLSEPKPIIGFKMDLSAFHKDQNQEKWPWNYEVMIHPLKPAIPKTAQPSSISKETVENPTNKATKCSPHGKLLELTILNEPKVFS